MTQTKIWLHCCNGTAGGAKQDRKEPSSGLWNALCHSMQETVLNVTALVTAASNLLYWGENYANSFWNSYLFNFRNRIGKFLVPRKNHRLCNLWLNFTVPFYLVYCSKLGEKTCYVFNVSSFLMKSGFTFSIDLFLLCITQHFSSFNSS